MENTTEVKIPKKRGRKPKSQKLAEENNNTEEPPPVKVVKKRGRKPKDKYSSSNKPPNSGSVPEVNNIILHLPINTKDMNEEFVDKEVFKYNPNLISPEPYNNDMAMAPGSSNISSPYPHCLNEDTTDIEEKKDPIISNDSDNAFGLEKDDLLDTNDNTGNNSRNQKNENTGESKVYLDKNINDYDILSVNTKNSFDIKSNISRESEICCYWCCHTFSNKPIGLSVIKMKSLVS